MKKQLSEKQAHILAFLKDYTEQWSRPPTVREIQKACQISSTSVVDYNLRLLGRDGYIRRDPDISRGIEVLDGTKPRTRFVSVPLIGYIAAGEPVPVPSSESWQPSEALETLQLLPQMLPSQGQVYALRVKGTSMIDALIDDGDVVLIQPASSVKNGDMVVAWLKNEKEATLKRFYLEKSRVRLQPANSQMQPIYTAPTNVEVQGKVVGVIRSLH